MAADSRTDKSSLSNHASFVYKHLNLSLSVDFERHVLEGVATWTVDVAEHRVAELVLDTSSELEVRSVTVCGAPAPHTMRPAHAAFGVACAITLPEGLGEQGRALEVAVTYATSPKSSALQWLPPAQTAGKERPFMFSQCQAIHARSMLPCPDGPAAKFTYDATVRVPEWATALMSAVAVGSPVASVVGGVPLRTFTFEQTCPLSSYLLALAVGDVRGINVGSRTTVWAEPSVVEAAAWEFAEAERFVAKAEELTQTPYAWGRCALRSRPSHLRAGRAEPPISLETSQVPSSQVPSSKVPSSQVPLLRRSVLCALFTGTTSSACRRASRTAAWRTRASPLRRPRCSRATARWPMSSATRSRIPGRATW